MKQLILFLVISLITQGTCFAETSIISEEGSKTRIEIEVVKEIEEKEVRVRGKKGKKVKKIKVIERVFLKECDEDGSCQRIGKKSGYLMKDLVGEKHASYLKSAGVVTADVAAILAAAFWLPEAAVAWLGSVVVDKIALILGSAIVGISVTALIEKMLANLSDSLNPAHHYRLAKVLGKVTSGENSEVSNLGEFKENLSVALGKANDKSRSQEEAIIANEEGLQIESKVTAHK